MDPSRCIFGKKSAIRHFIINREYFFYFVTWISLSSLEIFYGFTNILTRKLETLGGFMWHKNQNETSRFGSCLRFHETRKSNKLKPEVSSPGWVRGPPLRPPLREFISFWCHMKPPKVSSFHVKIVVKPPKIS